MKKLLVSLAAVLAIAAFAYYYFSAPRVIDRRLDSLLDTMSFGAVTLKNLDQEAADFADHFAESVIFSGSGSEVISGEVSRAEMQELYHSQFRVGAKSSQAKVIGETVIVMRGSDRAEMDTTVKLDLVLRDNMSYPQSIPARLQWRKREGKWRIDEVRMLEPVDEGY
ncbi:hypothetical protein [Roseibacillus ishigakijimensis]|uniref:SnoaL-like domain-containing protein n=1 Tax=Roseibacillus ishigakijimensis TaxID=454146 RepID=A0A934RS49_9BACT|nr:hypothetical protein [Roseibacillus ishigakijimensis]MBK1834927.1 hypothetical protein [Roseibacillus ishigakijimensis]